jgi:diguanylate cyclase (GGDEF)-like protein
LALAAIGVGIYLLLSFVGQSIFKVEITDISLALSIGTALLIAYAIYQTRNFAAKQIDRLFYRDSYQYRHELNEFARKRIRGLISLNELGTELLTLLCGAIKCRQSYLLLPREDTGDFYIRFAVPLKEDRPSRIIKRDSPIMQWMRTNNSYLSKERLEAASEFKSFWLEEKESISHLGIQLFFPIVSRRRIIGILALGEKMVKAKYTREDISLSERAVNDVATSLEKEYLADQLTKREQELSIINRLAGVISSSLNIQEVYDAFVKELKQVVEADFTAIVLVEGNEKYFSALSTEVGSAWHTGQKIPMSDTATEWVFLNKKPYYEKDLCKNKQFRSGEEFISRGIQSLCYLPLINKGEVIGVLILGSKKPEAYNAGQINLLERLSAQIAAPIENSRLYAKAEAVARVDAITGLFNRRYFDERLREEIIRRTDYGDTFSLILIDMDNFKKYNDTFGHMAGDRILVLAARIIEGLIRSSDVAFRYGGDEFVIILPNASTLDAFSVAERIREKIDCEMSIKQLDLSVSIGVASWPGDGATLDELCYAADMALYYAKHTGQNRTSIASKTLFSLNEPATNVNSEADVLATIYALAATLEARDKYTYGHSRRVSRYAVAAAEALNLPPEQVAIISAASLLHDIGKVGIPDNVLNKSGKLLDEEWELLKQHPKLSATIVGHIPSLNACLAAVRHHHERWDGNGYPSGLKGEEIPIEARILCVTDAFEAMISDRPYRGPLTFKKAIAELENCSGTQFDPNVVRVFIPIALSTATDDLELESLKNYR